MRNFLKISINLEKAKWLFLNSRVFYLLLSSTWLRMSLMLYLKNIKQMTICLTIAISARQSTLPSLKKVLIKIPQLLSSPLHLRTPTWQEENILRLLLRSKNRYKVYLMNTEELSKTEELIWNHFSKTSMVLATAMYQKCNSSECSPSWASMLLSL